MKCVQSHWKPALQNTQKGLAWSGSATRMCYALRLSRINHRHFYAEPGLDGRPPNMACSLGQRIRACAANPQQANSQVEHKKFNALLAVHYARHLIGPP
jgi:hypothetical protein